PRGAAPRDVPGAAAAQPHRPRGAARRLRGDPRCGVRRGRHRARAGEELPRGHAGSRRGTYLSGDRRLHHPARDKEGCPVTERDPERGEGRDPIDEEAAWAEIVAAYGEEPEDPPGMEPAGTSPAPEDRPGFAAGPGDRTSAGLAGPGRAADGSGARGPRDWEAAEDDEDDHFVPPEPPPLPSTDL